MRVQAIRVLFGCALLAVVFSGRHFIRDMEDFFPKAAMNQMTTTPRAMPWWQKDLCKNLAEADDAKMFRPQTLLRDITPNKDDYNIFLAETGCNPLPSYRAWCSVESFAHRNPTAKVWFLVMAPGVDDSDGLVSALTKEYSSLRVVGADLDRMFNDTPLNTIFTTRKWLDNTPWPPNNLSNLLRNVVTWLWGGFSSDTDCMCVRNLSQLRNVIAYDDSEQVANNALMHFDAGHPFVYEMMMHLKKYFQPATWHVNGPGTATAVAKNMCRRKNLNELLKNKCEYLTLLTFENLQLFSWKQWKKFFQREKGENVLEEHKNAYVMHIYNKVSKKTPIEINSSSIYEVVAKNFCPITYSFAKRRSIFF